MRDVVTSEYVLQPANGETIEIFQHRAEQWLSLVRVPVGGGPIAPLGSGVRVDATAAGASVVVAAPVAGSKNSVAGALAIAAPVDFAAVTSSLAAHVAQASIEGLGAPIALVAPHGSIGAAPIKLALPAAEWNPSHASLVATPLAGDPGPRVYMRAYLAPARYAGFGLAGVLLGVYVFGFVRRRGR